MGLRFPVLLGNLDPIAAVVRPSAEVAYALPGVVDVGRSHRMAPPVEMTYAGIDYRFVLWVYWAYCEWVLR